ncbi:MAG TPA: S41 family peptidase [Gemmatimonadaceae bacterium]|nr:S41 family peptidase [Gemmatimonadaceae bacterium]
MPRSRKILLAGLLFVPLLAGGFVSQQQATQDGARLLDQVLNIVSSRFVDTVDAATLYEKAARGLVNELNDPYSSLLSPKELSAFNAQTNGRYAGIGMEIGEVQGFVTVQTVFPHTPAEQAGVQEGDRINFIDTVNVRGWTTQQTSDALKGRPGSRVLVKFSRPGVPELIPITFTRAIISIPAVPYAIMLDGKVGYIPLLRFNESARDDLESSLKKLSREGAKGLIIDLRGNPGGILDQSLTVSNLFLRKGLQISSIRGRNGENQRFAASDDPVAPTIPLVILTDGRSASASEIVAGALQDHDRALIMGTTSFGKGLVQSVFPLEGGYALKMTTAKWYTPNGRSIQKERKLLPNGEFVEVMPDSLETDSVRRSRPVFRSDAGRVVYGGGAITPDIIVRPDTLSTAEQNVFKAFAPRTTDFFITLREYALELKPTVRPDFTVPPAWRAEFYRRLQAKGITVDRVQYDRAAPEIDRQLGYTVARLAFGDSTARRRSIVDDVQLTSALLALRQSQTQNDLFVLAAQQNAGAKLAEAARK